MKENGAIKQQRRPDDVSDKILGDMTEVFLQHIYAANVQNIWSLIKSLSLMTI